MEFIVHDTLLDTLRVTLLAATSAHLITSLLRWKKENLSNRAAKVGIGPSKEILGVNESLYLHVMKHLFLQIVDL